MVQRPRALVFAIDLGSSSVRTALFTDTGTRLPATMATRKCTIRYSQNGAAELDPLLLRRAARACTADTLRARDASNVLNKAVIVAAGGSAFWHALLGLDARHRPITPVFTWADSRSTPDAAELRRELDERQVQATTGCMLRAQFWPAKLRWLWRTDRALFRRVKRWASPASWIFNDLFGVEASSHSMASATGLYNLGTETWDKKIIGVCNLRVEQLETIRDSAPAAKELRTFRGAKILAAIGDGAASNLGSGADREGIAAINLGTSGAVRTIRKKAAARLRELRFGLFQYIVDPNLVIVGGAVSNAGNLREWCIRELNFPDAERALSRSAAAHNTVIALPFLVTERAPDWPETVHGTVTNLTQTTTAADLLRAAVTSTFYRLADILSLLDVKPAVVKDIIVSGGILHSLPSLRILADCLGRDIRVSRELESSLRGAAVYALRRLGYKLPSLHPGRIIRHDRALAAKHRQRRAAQCALQSALQKASLEQPHGGRTATAARAHRSLPRARKRSSG